MQAAMILLAPLVLVMACMAVPATPAATALAASSEAGTTTAMKILEQTGCNMFINLAKSTQAIHQIQMDLPVDSQGMTILAPSDDAFADLKAGTLNSLTEKEKTEIVQYHMLPKYYTQGQLQDASNPVKTMATGKHGPLGFTVTSSGASNSSVDISTGVDSTSVSGPVYSKPPFAVYRIDKLLLPNDIFGARAPAPSTSAVAVAPAPPPEAGTPVPASVPSRSRASVARHSCDSSVATAISAAPVAAGFLCTLFLFAVAAIVEVS